jgi:hypothetical protein
VAFADVTRTAPNREQLLDCARRLARELHAVAPPEVELRDRIEHVLWGRKQAWTRLDNGSVSEVEVRDLLIDHLDYECADISGRAWAEFEASERQTIVDAFDEVLFGHPAGN